MPAVFKLTKHAKQRLSERNIKPPKGTILYPVGKKTRRRIRESCECHGCNTVDYIYFMTRGGKIEDLFIYVCKQLDAGVFLLITAFKYKTLK